MGGAISGRSSEPGSRTPFFIHSCLLKNVDDESHRETERIIFDLTVELRLSRTSLVSPQMKSGPLLLLYHYFYVAIIGLMTS